MVTASSWFGRVVINVIRYLFWLKRQGVVKILKLKALQEKKIN